MKSAIIQEAIANIATTSDAIEKCCSDPKNHFSPYAASLLERISWELHRQASELTEINFLYGA